MAAEEKKKKKAPKPADAAAKKPAKAKKPKAEAVAEAPAKEKAPEAPRPPADPRMKPFKKLNGRFLPKGPLRERHREILTRWNATPDHDGVTVEELKSLVADWRASRAKPADAAKV